MRLIRDDMHDTRTLTRLLHEKGLVQGFPSRLHQQIDPDLLLLAAPRTPVAATIRLIPHDQSIGEDGQTQALQTIQALATDVGSAGLTVITEQPLPEDAWFTCDLSNLLGQPHQMTAQVIHCRKVLTQTFRVGLNFCNETTPPPFD